ncbi:MAG: ABC transporter permease subunit [Clostridiales bacterium]|nr:ABC transporter permease subunit [Clostridiales bacterium]
MKNYLVFLKKEFVESLRNYKFLILLVLFIMFGVSNPVMAKLLPKMLGSMDMQGMTIVIPEPSALDSWTQFYKNMSQMQIIILVIVFSGTIATELSKGTLVNILTKGVSRTSVVLAKFTSISLVWTACYWLCFGITTVLTGILLPSGGLTSLVFSAFGLWIFGIMIISVLILFNCLTGNIFASLLGTGGFAVTLSLLSMIAKIKDYIPTILSTANLQIIQGELKPMEFVPATVIACGVTIVSIISAISIFRKKQL